MSISTMLSASHRKPDTVELTPSLANYYDSKLTGHVTGWPGDQVEKQVWLHAVLFLCLVISGDIMNLGDETRKEAQYFGTIIS